MHYHILTLFPEMVTEGLKTSILGRAAQKGLLSVEAVNIRDFTLDKHNKVDDYPYGGGAGMLMQAQPVYDAFWAVREKIAARRQAEGAKKDGAVTRVVYVTPQGRVFNQDMARSLAKEEDLVFLCGHYEGVDERVLEEIVTDYISIGDYVLTGGELPAMVMIDAVSRMVPGVLKNGQSGETESFQDNLLEYPQYTRPEVWRGRKVPEVLLSGDHAKVEKWRLERSVERTKERRPDLYEKYDLPGRALDFLKQDRLLHMDMIEDIRRDKADILAVRPDGVLLADKKSGVHMITAQNKDAGERLLSCAAEDVREFTCHQRFLVESISARLGFQNISECLQMVYTRKTPFEERSDILIRPLNESFTETVQEHYPLFYDRQHIRGMLKRGVIYGAFPGGGTGNGVLAGFIGIHDEGGMGMLEVFEPYRRRGIGEALEKYLINRQLEWGYTPYVQVFTHNDISLRLQRKLGLKLCRERVYWIS